MTPWSLREYEAHDGFQALRRALKVDGYDILLSANGIQGRAAQPTTWAASGPRPGTWTPVRNADEGEPGTKMISVSGNVNKPGVFEIPFGTTIREIIERTGGVTEGQTLRLVQLGGASGRIASPEQLDTPYTTT